MSPEQLGRTDAVLDHRTDIYSLGVVLYELLTLQRPHAWRGRARRPLPPRAHNRAIPVALEHICLRAMAPQPRQRYVDAAALARDLQRFVDHRPVDARPSRMGRLIDLVRGHVTGRWLG